MNKGKIVGVSGASGQLGRLVMAEIESAHRPHAVVGISRTPESVMPQADARYGNYDEPGSLSQAYQGLDRLLLIPSPVLSEGLLARHLRAAIDSALVADVGHIVLISSVACDKNDDLDVFSGFYEGERHLIETAPSWTILRMNFFAETFLQLATLSIIGKSVFSLGDNRVAFVSRQDVAKAAASILTNEGHGSCIYNATGPHALNVRERVDILSEIVSEELNISTSEVTQFRQSLLEAGMPHTYINAMIDMERRFTAGCFDIVTNDIQNLTGRPIRSLREVIKLELG